MRLVRFVAEEIVRFGVLENDRVWDVEGPFGRLEPRPRVQALPLASVRLLAPIEPSKIVLASTNYHSVARLFGREPRLDPVIFFKPPSAVIGPGDAIVYPALSRKLTYEPELAVVIRRRCRNLAPEEVAGAILGYTCLNDVSALDLVERDNGHFSRGKGFDTFAPIGPWIETELDPHDIRLAAYLNGQQTITTPTADMIVSVAGLVSYVSQVMTLQPGDVISTGASGIEEMHAGDTIEIEVQGVGRLVNPVTADPVRASAPEGATGGHSS